jgi:hypothetical protein
MLGSLMDEYTVLIADIKESRKMQEYERYEWQLFLKSAIVQVNESYRPVIEASFMITKGDEFQGVLKSLSDTNLVIMKFEELLYPLHLRFGVGCGPIQKMGSIIPIEMDGRAFHLANNALNIAKKKKRMVHMESGDDRLDVIVNTIYQLIGAIKKGWSDTNYKRYWKYQKYGTYERVASEEGVSVQAVWDSMHSAGAMDVYAAEQALNEIMQLQPDKNL